MTARILEALLGVWLMAAPSVLGFAGEPSGKLLRVLGPLAVTAGITATAGCLRDLRWINTALGALTVVSPLVVRYPDPRSVILMVVTGLALVALSLYRGPVTSRYDGGWKMLWRSGE